MRWKIIVVNAGIVAIVGVLSYFLLVASLSNVLSNPSERRAELKQALRSANAQLQLDALRVERWLAERADNPPVRDVFAASTLEARRERATALANKLRDAAVRDAQFAKMAPTLVLVVDKGGVGLGRNGSTAMRGTRFGDTYPALVQALRAAVPGSDVWLNRSQSEHMLTSYAPIHGEGGEVLGGLVLGTPLNDDRLTRTSELTSGHALFLAVMNEKALDIIARGHEAGVGAAASPEVERLALRALSVGSPSLTRVPDDRRNLYGVGPLRGYGPKPQAVLIAAVPVALVPSAGALLWPVVGGTALGLLLVVIAGTLLGNYLSRPISELEDGLLAVINGRTDLRFQIEHAELGGLVFRINSLLNALMGVAEDTTDDRGRPSRPPTGRDFQEALAVDESSATSSNAELAQALAQEPEDLYYARVFKEYVAAKRKIGDPTDHITQDAFTTRLKSSEQELSQKHGRPVRYQVELRNNGVVLIAVPLP